MEYFTDGSCTTTTKQGGWAYLNINTNFSDYDMDINTTNNKMEITAVIKAIENAIKNEYKEIIINTDSNYVILGINEWHKQWIKNGWLTANKKPVQNKELWKQLIELNSKLKIEWKWVKAHNGNKYNEIVDKLAKNAYK